MTKTAHFIFRVDTNKPFHKSSGIINDYWKNALSKFGYKLISFHQRRVTESILPGQRLIPLEIYSLIHKISLENIPDITFYDDHGLAIKTPLKRDNHKNILFFHGLRGNPGSVLANPLIDFYCCNSNYLKNVLSSFMLFPNFEKKSIIDAHGINSITSITLPVPMIDFPNGYENEGADLPSIIHRTIINGYIIGHSIQRDKPVLSALVFILKYLNELCENNGTKKVKLVIRDNVLTPLKKFIYQQKNINREKILDYFIPVPLMNNSATTELMESSSFGLCYNCYPESFGIYPLESVMLNSPIYTNGIGNNRYLLPSGHGIDVFETKGMEFGNFKEYEKVAEKIFHDLHSNQKANNCEKGLEYIRKTYNKAQFEESVFSMLDLLYSEKIPYNEKINFDDLTFYLSPLVRNIDTKTGHVISDYKSIILSREELDLLILLVGKKIKDMDNSLTNKLGNVYSLFYKGIIALNK